MPRPARRTRAAASRKLVAQASVPQPAQPSREPSSDIYGLSDRAREEVRRGKMPARDSDSDNEQTGGARLTVGLEARQARDSDQSMRKRDAAFNRLDNITSTSKTLDVSSSDVANVSGLDLEDSMFGDLDLDLDLDDSLDIGQDTRTGLQSAETSSLNVAAFRRRPRASSIVGRDDAPIRPSSRGPTTPGISSTINFGNFKRRQREPSILGTARKHRSRSRQPVASEDESDNDIGGTPLGRTSSRQASKEPTQEGAKAVPLVQQGKKRKSLEEQGGSARKRTAVEPEDEVHDTIEIDDNMRQEDSDSVLSSLPTTPARGPSPDPNDPDLAPPASISSSDISPVAATCWDALTHRNYNHKRQGRQAQKTPELDEDASDISSPPSLTHSPNYTAPPPKSAQRGRTRKREPEPAPKVTTAELESLLPRHRHKQRNKDPFDVSSDAEEGALTFDNDEDELSYVHTRRTKRTTRPLRDASKNRSKGKQQATGKGAKRTYGSKSSDKENDDDEDAITAGGGLGDGGEDEATPASETSQVMLERMGEELKNAAKKFKEVDKWELEFEEITEPSSEAV
ncbi:hypothetical protein DL546_002543 [Coniochaeta pulveracea]|uniref:Uncharacterized protein n=1 Tax=Coniochaeta pulveracea TaxID=177199 RepID=A0A420Y4P3_9PEZI|nr:hypothetical protein DL546_002543 [Coniochaeta pulveracea]